MLKRFLFPSNPDGTFISVILLTVGVPRSSRHRQSPFSGIGHLWRTGMLNGIHHRLLIQIGNDSYDIYDVCGILHCSWQ